MNRRTEEDIAAIVAEKKRHAEEHHSKNPLESVTFLPGVPTGPKFTGSLAKLAEKEANDLRTTEQKAEISTVPQPPPKPRYSGPEYSFLLHGHTIPISAQFRHSSLQSADVLTEDGKLSDGFLKMFSAIKPETCEDQVKHDVLLGKLQMQLGAAVKKEFRRQVEAVKNGESIDVHSREHLDERAAHVRKYLKEGLRELRQRAASRFAPIAGAIEKAIWNQVEERDTDERSRAELIGLEFHASYELCALIHLARTLNRFYSITPSLSPASNCGELFRDAITQK